MTARAAWHAVLADAAPGADPGALRLMAALLADRRFAFDALLTVGDAAREAAGELMLRGEPGAALDWIAIAGVLAAEAARRALAAA